MVFGLLTIWQRGMRTNPTPVPSPTGGGGIAVRANCPCGVVTREVAERRAYGQGLPGLTIRRKAPAEIQRKRQLAPKYPPIGSLPLWGRVGVGLLAAHSRFVSSAHQQLPHNDYSPSARVLMNPTPVPSPTGGGVNRGATHPGLPPQGEGRCRLQSAT